MNQLSPIPPPPFKAMMKARRSKERAILTSLKCGEGWSRCSLFLVQDCRFQPANRHSRPQRPRSFWSAPRIATSGPTTGSLQFTDFPSLCACSESSIANLIGSGLNLLCFQSHSKPECRWTWPEVAILGADQKERVLYGQECHS